MHIMFSSFFFFSRFRRERILIKWVLRLSLFLRYSTFMPAKAVRLTNAKISRDINALAKRRKSRERARDQDVYRKRHRRRRRRKRKASSCQKRDKYVRGERSRRLCRNHLVGRLVLPRRMANIARESIASRRAFSLPVIGVVLWETNENNNDLEERKTRKYRRYAGLECTLTERIFLFAIVSNFDCATVLDEKMNFSRSAEKTTGYSNSTGTPNTHSILLIESLWVIFSHRQHERLIDVNQLTNVIRTVMRKHWASGGTRIFPSRALVRHRYEESVYWMEQNFSSSCVTRCNSSLTRALEECLPSCLSVKVGSHRILRLLEKGKIEKSTLLVLVVKSLNRWWLPGFYQDVFAQCVYRRRIIDAIIIKISAHPWKTSPVQWWVMHEHFNASLCLSLFFASYLLPLFLFACCWSY